MTDKPTHRARGIGLILAVAVAGALVLNACGNGDEAAEDSTTTAETSTSSSTDSSRVRASTSDPVASTADPADTSSTSTSTTSSTEDSDPTGPTVDVFYGVAASSDCGEVQPFTRRLDNDFEVYRQTFQQLVAGPSATEITDVAASFFSSDTADVVTSAILADGLLTVDFVDLRPLIPNASTSCGSEALLAQLNATAFQFDSVQRTRYLLEGSCNDFANWLQRECFDSDRSGRQLDVTTNEQASGAGCTPASTETLPTGRWFGFITDAQPEELTFDLACWFDGAVAAAAAAEDGDESPPPNDYHIRNESDRLRVHVVESGIDVVWLPDPGDTASTETTTYESWLAGRTARSFQPGVWITTTDDSHVVKIEEQYVP